MMHALKLGTARLILKLARFVGLPLVISGDGGGNIRWHWMP